jgi:transcriptional regulator with GAF, ATPase, and Fis domain
METTASTTERLAQALQKVGSANSVDEMLSELINTCLELCGAERVAIILHDPSSKEVVKTLVRGSTYSAGRIDHRLNLLVAGFVQRSGKPLRTRDILKELSLTEPPEKWRELGPAIAVPLLFAGERLGVLNLVNSRQGREFSEQDLQMANSIGALAAQFIRHTNLHERLFEENRRLREQLQERSNIYGIAGTSPKMKAVIERIPTVAKSNATVLITGETGTGKELVARAIHAQSDRADKPFIPINCAAIPANLIESELFGHERGAFTGAHERLIGKFEFANHGTIFLDEISEMSLELQPKLLRVLEEKKFFRIGSSKEVTVDVRVIAASSKDLALTVSEGKFRPELLYRIDVIPLYLPSLRERKEDIPVLAQHFLNEFSRGTKKFSQQALDILGECEWKGNVRELRNIVERIHILIPSSEMTPDHLETIGLMKPELPLSLHQLHAAFDPLLESGGDSKDLLEEVEKNLVKLALLKSNGNVRGAARLLGIDHMALDRRKKKYNL